MSKKIRIGVIGAGNNTKLKHIPGFQALDDVEVIVVCNRSVHSSRTIAQEFKIPWVAANWQEVINHAEVDAVCIGTPPNMHAEPTIEALKKGKHVLVEARMATNLQQAKRMFEAAKVTPHVVAQIVPAPYSLDIDFIIQEIVASGKLGYVREIRAQHLCGDYADAFKEAHWRLDETISGKNILSLGIIHEMVCRWLPVKLEWVCADAMYYTTERKDAKTGLQAMTSLPESISVLGRTQFGGRLVYDISSVVQGPPIMQVWLSGEKGGLRIDLLKQEVFFTPTGSNVEEKIEIPEKTRRGWQVEKDFVHSIRTKTPVTLTNFEMGLRYMEFTENVWQSWTHRGERIRFDR